MRRDVRIMIRKLLDLIINKYKKIRYKNKIYNVTIKEIENIDLINTSLEVFIYNLASIVTSKISNKNKRNFVFLYNYVIEIYDADKELKQEIKDKHDSLNEEDLKSQTENTHHITEEEMLREENEKLTDPFRM